MKIVMLMGSPRRGDSERVCRRIEERLGTYFPELQVEYLRPSRMRIEPCRGCSICFQKGDVYCPIGDDTAEVRKLLGEADGIVFASPVYACQITGSLKLLIDRLSYLFHRPEFVGTKAMVVTTTDGGGAVATRRYLKMTAAGWGCRVISLVDVVSSRFFRSRPFNNYYQPGYARKAEEKIVRAADRFAESLQEQRSKQPSYYDLWIFNGLRSKTYTSEADHRFWEERGWIEQDYFYPVSLGPGKLLFSRLLKALIAAMAGKMLSRSSETTTVREVS